ncbi:MAG TPA: glycosyltransferase family 39 protein, partial [Geobacteraceae bacterium]
MKRALAMLREKREPVLLVLILILGFVLRMAFLHEPFERDEGLYGYIGQEILRGAIPYSDIADIKPPGAFYIYAAMIALFGNTLEAIRVATAVYALATTFFVYRLARYVQGAAAGLAAAFLFAVFSPAPLTQGSSSNTEVFVLLPLVISVYLLVRGADSGRRLYFAGSGFFAGAALLIKTVALPFLLVILAFVALRPGFLKQWKSRLLDVCFFVAPPLLSAL